MQLEYQKFLAAQVSVMVARVSGLYHHWCCKAPKRFLVCTGIASDGLEWQCILHHHLL